MDIKSNPSEQQRAIFGWFETGTGNLVARAAIAAAKGDKS